MSKVRAKFFVKQIINHHNGDPKADQAGEVVLGPVWVWLVLGETAPPNTLIGGTILLTAIAGNALSGARRKPPPPPL